MKKIKDEIIDNSIFFVSLIILYIAKNIYLSNATANVPIMDYWRYAYKMLDKIHEGGITFNDLYESINGQRGFLNHLLFYLNVKFFNWNTRIDIFLGAFVALISSIIIFLLLKREVAEIKSKQNVKIQLVGILIASIMFNYQQWEIETIQFSFSFSIMILLLLIIGWITSRLLQEEMLAKKYILYYCLFLVVCICMVFSAFFPAMLLGIGMSGLISFIVMEKETKIKYIKYYFFVTISIIIGFLFYFYNLEGASGVGYSVDDFFASIKNGVFIKALLYYLGGSVLHTNFFDYGSKIYYLVGMCVFFLYIISIVCFFKAGIYKKNHLPFILIVYSLGIGLLLSYGRALSYDPEYLIASRYSYQSKVGIVGVVWIVFLFLSGNIQLNQIIKNSILFVLFGFILFFEYKSFVFEKRIEPFRRNYYETEINLIKNPSEINESNAYVFQDKQEHVEYVIPLMKKHKLGIFKE